MNVTLREKSKKSGPNGKKFLRKRNRRHRSGQRSKKRPGPRGLLGFLETKAQTMKR